MSQKRQIYCCGCITTVKARLTDGKEIYPHRRDLARLPFWKCDKCLNYVGCHHKTHSPTNPLGVIPTKEIKAARWEIHNMLDPLWKNGKMTRRQVYSAITEKIGWKFHTANIRNVKDAGRVIAAINEIIILQQEQ